ncbi:hypothetical protein KNJ79_09005 [Sphingopyxis indica]|uniref:hypothetical protein n=1 Tax=Sphingopyxis indica TaxID=436663 RepID=UPI002938FBC2|nr:hypothetical protein [Sphingopyxis indica]WOF44992.1 hypothetical protein KNJ79_09005 [Sphingopyxis indica]
MKGGLLVREIAPFYASLAVLLGVALLLDAILHLFDAVWIGRWLGIPGLLLILGSFGHSLRKRKIIRSGNPIKYLRLHERMGWAGSLLVLVHAGIHFNAVLAWLAVVAMLINVTSGLTGKYLLQRAQRWLREARTQMREAGAESEEIELKLYWDSLAFDLVKQWRKVHLPIALAFAVLALAHIIAIFLFWNWR